MANPISDFLTNADIGQYIELLRENNYFEIFFPFLLIYAVLNTILHQVSIFRSKKTGKPYNSAIVVISLVVAAFSVTFEITEGKTVGYLLSLLFPNISTLTIGILTLYLVGSMLNKNFFKDMFRKDVSSYMVFLIGAIGVGAVFFYLGIVFGFFDYNPLDPQSYWNFILALAGLIAGIVMLIIGLFGPAIVIFLVLGSFILSSGDENILSFFIDPIVFITILVIVLMSWMNTTKEKKHKAWLGYRDSRNYLEATQREDGKEPDSRIRDIQEQRNIASKKQYEELHGEEPPK